MGLLQQFPRPESFKLTPESNHNCVFELWESTIYARSLQRCRVIWHISLWTMIQLLNTASSPVLTWLRTLLRVWCLVLTRNSQTRGGKKHWRFRRWYWWQRKLFTGFFCHWMRCGRNINNVTFLHFWYLPQHYCFTPLLFVNFSWMPQGHCFTSDHWFFPL